MKYAMIFLMFLAMSVGAVEPQRWVGVPVFYSKFVPKATDCTFIEGAQQGFCGLYNETELGTFGLTTIEETPTVEKIEARLFMEVVCVAGKCTSPYGEPAGEITDIRTSYWTVPVGWYLTTIDGKVKAFKAGNGPKAKDYPIRNVKILPKYNDQPDGYYIPEETERLVFRVFCNDGNECSYMGKVINYAQLNKYVPKRLSHQCDPRFCYDDKQNIIGLNPRG